MGLKAAFIAGAAAALAAGSAWAAALENPSFEDDLNGWTADPDQVQVTNAFNHFNADGDLDMSYGPVDGDFFAMITAGDQDSPVLLTQSFTTTGGVFSGWAAFLAGDYQPYNDYGYVRIYNDDGSQLLFSKDVVAVGDYGYTQWTKFSARLAPGHYTIEAAATNIGDHDQSSYLLLDNFHVQGVPEPAVWALMIVGFFGAGALLRYRRAARV